MTVATNPDTNRISRYLSPTVEPTTSTVDASAQLHRQLLTLYILRGYATDRALLTGNEGDSRRTPRPHPATARNIPTLHVMPTSTVAKSEEPATRSFLERLLSHTKDRSILSLEGTWDDAAQALIRQSIRRTQLAQELAEAERLRHSGHRIEGLLRLREAIDDNLRSKSFTAVESFLKLLETSVDKRDIGILLSALAATKPARDNLGSWRSFRAAVEKRVGQRPDAQSLMRGL